VFQPVSADGGRIFSPDAFGEYMECADRDGPMTLYPGPIESPQSS